ncbi:uncharacterized protein LOC134712873 [Mytilus trossulus]|uniref:uncharacterized protein LOC134712873 n=1 Tax=Mytilus trossulus TaxID=6551 RepID=UPI003004C052
MSRWIFDLNVKDRYKQLMRNMLCACGNESTDNGPIIDIDQVLQDYAWRELKRDARWYQSPLLRRSFYEIEIPWNFYEFSHKTVNFSLRNNNHISSDGLKNRKQVELFSTQYENNTAKDQVYNLKTNRQTQARTYVSFQKGFAIKGKANFSIDIPERFGHCGVTASASGKLKVTKIRGESLEEMFAWQVDSDITVDPYHVTNVKLVVTEDEFVADFEIKTTLRMPTGEAPIILKRKRDNHIQAVLLISDLHEAFSDLSNTVVNFVKSDSTGSPKGVVEFCTTGILDSVRWRDQRITIESKPLSPSITEAADLLYDIPLYAKDIYSQVIKHATKEKENRLDMRTQDQINQGGSASLSKTETRDLRLNIIPKIITEGPESDVFFKDSDISMGDAITALSVAAHPIIRQSELPKVAEEIKIDMPKVPEPQQPTQQQRRPSLTSLKRSAYDSPLQVIKELSLEDKQKSEDSTNSPDSSDSQRFSKVTSV